MGLYDKASDYMEAKFKEQGYATPMNDDIDHKDTDYEQLGFRKTTAAERAYWNHKMDIPEYDTVPTLNSTKLVTSDGIARALTDSGRSAAVKALMRQLDNKIEEAEQTAATIVIDADTKIAEIVATGDAKIAEIEGVVVDVTSAKNAAVAAAASAESSKTAAATSATNAATSAATASTSATTATSAKNAASTSATNAAASATTATNKATAAGNSATAAATSATEAATSAGQAATAATTATNKASAANTSANTATSAALAASGAKDQAAASASAAASSAADAAAAAASISIATSSHVGTVKPDGTTTAVDANGAISALFQNISYDSTLSTASSKAPKTSVVTTALDNINVYVDAITGKLHFVDRTGADSELPFSKGGGTDYALVCSFQGTMPTYNTSWRQATDAGTSYYNTELCTKVADGRIVISKTGTVKIIYSATPYNSSTTSNYRADARVVHNDLIIGTQAVGTGVGGHQTIDVSVSAGDSIRLESAGRGAADMTVFFIPTT